VNVINGLYIYILLMYMPWARSNHGYTTGPAKPSSYAAVFYGIKFIATGSTYGLNSG